VDFGEDVGVGMAVCVLEGSDYNGDLLLLGGPLEKPSFQDFLVGDHALHHDGLRFAVKSVFEDGEYLDGDANFLVIGFQHG
jgi:hypothetical protein